jgi:uncharacterized protein
VPFLFVRANGTATRSRTGAVREVGEGEVPDREDRDVTDVVERHGYPPGVPCWIELLTPEPRSAAGFHATVFDWRIDEREVAGAPYLVARRDGRDVAAIAHGPAPATWVTSVAVDDLDAVLARVGPAGGRVLAPAGELGDLARTAEVADPTGARLRLWQARSHPGAVLVNVDGSWNSSDLVTTDRAAAVPFLERLFGWVADDVGDGDWSATMLRLPGYGDHLASIDPDIRERHDEPGVPPGFSDAVGWLEEDAAASGGSHWRVTFTADDPDEVARRAEAAGGTVVVPPTDTPPVRFTVLRDPAGAVFTASSYRP